MSARSTGIAGRIRGPVVPINICFNEDGSVDFPSVIRYVDWLCANGVPVLSMATGSSEFVSLTDDDIWELTSKIAEVNQGRSVYIAGTGHWKVNQCRQFLSHADAVGADAVRVQISPMYTSGGPEVYMRYFDQIEGASDIPLVLEDGAPPVSMGAELANRPNVVAAMIHDYEAYLDLTTATVEEEFSTICAGRMRYMIYGHQAGSTAYQCGIAPVRPDIALEFYKHIDARRYNDAWNMVYEYEDPWFDGILGEGHDWIESLKTVIHLMGIYPNNRKCPPWPEVPSETFTAVRALAEKLFGPIERVAL